MNIEPLPEWVKKSRWPDWVNISGLLPNWLPDHVKSYLVGMLLNEEKSPSAKGKKSIRHVLSVFHDEQMRQVWKKIASLREDDVFYEDAAFRYCSAIVSCRASLAHAKRMRQYAADLKEINARVCSLHKAIQNAKREYSWYDETQQQLCASLAANIKKQYQQAQALTKTPYKAPYGGAITRKQSGEKALMILCARSLSEVVRDYTKRSFNDEIATTISVLFEGVCTYDQVKSWVGAHPAR